MVNITKVSLDKVSKEDLIGILGNQYRGELKNILLDIFHRLLYDTLTLDDIVHTASKYGIYNLDSDYYNLTESLIDDEEY